MRRGLAVVLLLLLESPARAGEPVAIWYRSAEGCPDGSAFLRELERRATSARLAGMGDRVSGFATLPRAVTKDVEVWLLRGRAEVCPWTGQLDALELIPCAGVELAALGAERDAPGQPRDSTLWAALAAHARLRWLITEHIALEAQAGGVVPLGRHDFLAETPGCVVARTQALGFAAGLGARVRLP